MEITLTTPALLFPAISMLLLAYTNRFIALASLIRNLKDQYTRTQNSLLMGQISNLRERLFLIRNMQALGIASMFLCVLCMFVLFAENQTTGKYLFAVSLALLLASLGLSFREIQISVNALTLELSDLENLKAEQPTYRTANQK
ncbi:DUF2721 domain-containing protein [Adhaeribacter pallidiroseus]|uniref:DUF2721 domain-containing protein n=1 Tax=Adhaeribacter pallidiroseus TaxID=2072847 RepID=A0A369QL67_9BACT|nr:DUF2721 domain-containing protein [Adhaeribacter pallidiroseus]RDC65090.1 hypothetical protein AHMF7616_03714 [Adhaeribacter pallidiroseus]